MQRLAKCWKGGESEQCHNVCRDTKLQSEDDLSDDGTTSYHTVTLRTHHVSTRLLLCLYVCMYACDVLWCLVFHTAAVGANAILLGQRPQRASFPHPRRTAARTHIGNVSHKHVFTQAVYGLVSEPYWWKGITSDLQSSNPSTNLRRHASLNCTILRHSRVCARQSANKGCRTTFRPTRENLLSIRLYETIGTAPLVVVLRDQLHKIEVERGARQLTNAYNSRSWG